MRRLVLALCLAAAPAAAEAPFPIALGGPFALTDQDGQRRTEADPEGHAQLLFFGYAGCQEICSAALPEMAGAVDLLADQGHAVTPVMITVDPERDTPRVMKTALRQHHTDFVGLTGRPRALQRAYDAYQVETEELFRDPAGNPVYAHGSLVYLLDGEGTLMTVLPPILPAAEIARIAATYLPMETAATD